MLFTRQLCYKHVHCQLLLIVVQFIIGICRISMYFQGTVIAVQSSNEIMETAEAIFFSSTQLIQ